MAEVAGYGYEEQRALVKERLIAVAEDLIADGMEPAAAVAGLLGAGFKVAATHDLRPEHVAIAMDDALRDEGVDAGELGARHDR